MQDHHARIVAARMEEPTETGPEGMAQAFTALFDLAMRMERERHLGAGVHERAETRRGYASGTEPKTVDPPAGALTLRVPRAAAARTRSSPVRGPAGGARRAVTLAIAQMDVQGVSTRDAAKVMAMFRREGLSST